MGAIGSVFAGSCDWVLHVHAVHEDPENADEHRVRVLAGNRDSCLAGGSDLGGHVNGVSGSETVENACFFSRFEFSKFVSWRQLEQRKARKEETES